MPATEDATAVGVLEQLQMSLSPGGREEATHLIARCRALGIARTAKEAKDLLGKWKAGRKRLMVVLQAADLSPIEREEALMQMVYGVVQQDEGVRYRYQQVVWGKANQSPT